ncbi:hypothetical protein GCM10010458_24320 [Microbacterium luteolum]|uniref:Uncharacterized protein n=1 Tax=Microbacterium luteolum TaxID=69367 RepID=A0ABY7XWJ1_MICLT|nr:hypothetical protein [Microbacterium luteolum]WDM45068.1 hypothetical protein KV395_18245 [Microbacterium luteolum]
METLLIVLGVLAAAWFAMLMRKPRSSRRADPDGFAVDPALSKALDDSASDSVRFRGYP